MTSKQKLILVLLMSSIAITSGVIWNGFKCHRAVYFLEAHPPMFSPVLHFTDEAKRHHAEELFAEQMDALDQARKCTKPSIIPVLIPFLDYTSDDRSQLPYEDAYKYLLTYKGGPPGPTLKSLSEVRPALAAIVAMPGSSGALLTYALNTHNDLNLRLAAFHILRYTDTGKFRIAADTLNKELASRGPVTQSFLKPIVDGSLIFDGIHPSTFPD